MGLQTTKQFSDYIGIPYESVNCWGLVVKFYKNEFNIELKTPYKKSPENRSVSDAHVKENLHKFKKTNTPEYGDIILFNVLGTLSHVGIYLDEVYMLHTDSGHDSAMDKWSGSKWFHRVHGFYKVDRNAFI